jgi:ferric-dicitrate binding protein FerR (iron transport regulator)
MPTNDYLLKTINTVSRQQLVHLLKSYRKGACTPQELTLLYKWLHELGRLPLEDTPELAAIRREIKERIWQQQQELMRVATPLLTSKRAGRLIFLPRRFIGVAAAAIVIIITGVCLFVGSRRYHSRFAPVAANAVQKSVPYIVQPARDTLLINSTAGIQRLRLADGSVIDLSPRSRIRISNPWPASGRQIWLNGEACFDAARDVSHPFIVYAKGFSATVLGTVFRISAYDSTGNGRVHLLSGKVVLRHIKDPFSEVMMLPGDAYAFNEHTSRLTPCEEKKRETAVRPEPAPAVTVTGEMLVFDNASLPEVFKALSEAYKTRIFLENPGRMHNRKFTGNFRRERSLDQVLTTLASLNELRLIHTDSSYSINTK